MAKRTNGSTAAPRRNGNGPSADAGNDRPTLSVRTNDKGQIFSHIRQKWLVETSEERVRQACVVTLYNEYGCHSRRQDARPAKHRSRNK